MIVLDASAVVEIVHRTPDGQAIREFLEKGEKKISCSLLSAELASVFRKLCRTEGISAQIAEQYLIESMGLVDEFYPIEDLQPEVLRESIRLDHSVYDMFYFVLARRTGATLITLDRKLMRLCHDHGVDSIAEIGFPSGIPAWE